MKLIGVIPARYASTRMPGKPLADILGKPMIWWVYQEAKKCKKLDDVFIATDDERIAEACRTYGSEDGVLNREKYEADRINLPQDTTETVIDGGCHAGFGSYGAQKGDGTPTISAEEQQQQTADEPAAWMNLQ